MLRSFALLFMLSLWMAPVLGQPLRLDHVDLGIRAGYEFDDVDRPSLGAESRIYLKDRPFFFNVAFDVYVMNERPNLWQVDANVLYLFHSEAPLSPYMGGGLGYTHIAFDGRRDSETGINLVLGLHIQVTYVQVFVQGRSTLSNFDTVSAQAGVSFPFFSR